ncbi:MAG TPA: peptidylprolyl isomerase [Thermoanaerobaculia bacterium]|jgi:cyclophilin family peptidyl-prolyl cis-trans isomerase/HEAT repeat protein/thiol-disulfide isomerase/thioredoxin
MRKLLPLLLILACTTTTTPPPPSAPAPVTPKPAEEVGPHGLTVSEEARILQMEDRREYDRVVVAEWIKHPNALHRLRMAQALGRIGAHTFVDADEDGQRSPATESMAGVEELATLVSDPDSRVREMVAFSLGEIGDDDGATALFYLTGDPDAGVAAEAVEALSKLAADKLFVRDQFRRYAQLTSEPWPEGIRARAIRFLFRFDTDEASGLALDNLGSPSAILRQEAAYALSRRPFAPAASSLQLVLTDPNPLTRAYALTALGRIGTPSAARQVFEALGDAHPWVRTNAAVAMARIAEKTPSVLREEDLPRIFALTEDPDPGTRTNAIDLLGRYAAVNETARERLFATVRNGTRWQREEGRYAIAKYVGGERWGEYLYEVDDRGKVRVLDAVNTAAGKPAREVYAKEANPTVRAQAVSTIPDDNVDAEIATVRLGMNDADIIVRAQALDRYRHNTLDDLNTKVATLRAAEQRARTDAMNDARLSAVSALASIDFPGRESYLRELVKDNDPVVRRVAAEAIEQELKLRRPQYTPLPTRLTQAEYEEIVRWSRTPHTASIHMTRGTIQMALLTQDAPVTTWNFAQLAKKGYFDNTSFMRVVPNFVIQGGDPRNDMSGGPGYAIRDEINLQKYTRGAVGMALSGPDTGGSQFFITHSPQPHLDGGYTIFGRVYDGMNGVVDQVERGDAVRTITIDERPAPGTAELNSVPNVSLPLTVGEKTAAELMRVLPEYDVAKKAYNADISVIEMMKSYVRAGDRAEVFMGTWCPDSLREVPKFLRIVDDLKTQFGVDLPVRYFALDKSKQEPKELLTGRTVDKVATFIYYRGENELGRIVERPTGVFEDDLLTIVARQ